MTSPPVLPPFDAETRRRLDSVGWLQDDRAVEPLRAIWSGPDPIGAVERVVVYLEASLPDLDPLTNPTLALRLAHLAGGSRELMSQLTRHPTWLAGAEPGDLRGLARSTLAAVAAQDLAGMIDVAEGGRRLSEMADEVVSLILADETTSDCPPLAVMAFGKWGGRELNYWSDIDLIFVFEGGPDEAAAANRVATGVMRRLGNGGIDGEILRADADLRPEGARGPLARSLTAYRTYYDRWAEPWEFQALLKIRPAVGDRQVGERFMEIVNDVLWPETINPSSIRTLRSLKARVEANASPGDLKRGPGGIRDIEFAIQMLQLVHGRFDAELRQTSTLDLLGSLAGGGYIAEADATTLGIAYRWLRAAEHRIQLWDLRPTHELPREEADRERLARAMGYRGTAARTARDGFEADLVSHRSTVRRIHEDLYFRPLLEAFAATPATGLSREGAERRLTALGFRDIPGAVKTFEALTAGLSRRSRLMQQMLPLILDWLADSPDPDLGLDQLRLLAANVPDHAELITTLHDRPTVGRRLCFLLGSSRLLGDYLDRIPEFVPRLNDDDALVELRGRQELEQRLRRRLDSRPDPAEQAGTVRRFARRQLLRVAARDLLDLADVDQTMADLTVGADVSTSVAASLAGGDDGFAVIAMGRWGGRELSYGSDLDLLYVYDEPHDHPSAMRIAVAFRDLLARPGQDGVAWDLDANLRPEGRSGPLVRSLGSYESYYDRWAQIWEFQALVKARAVAGDRRLGERFMETIAPHVWRHPFPAEATVEIRRMKARVEKERIPPGEDRDFHLKLGPGALVDIEFLVQLLQLRHGGADPSLRRTGTMQALTHLESAGMVTPDQAADLAAAYRFCTMVRNRLYLQTGRRIDSLPTAPAQEGRLAISLGFQRRSDLREEYRRLTRRSRRVVDDLFY
ncbi:MAG: bifunctional [glutamine synthetase] adenylyltransferase/[glutamine synthetase]-adenylyl-L-tyrosine phosphorylase [Acidimicrobiia bacterium]